MMRNNVKTAPRKPETEVQESDAQDKCCHYWKIETPNGPTSKGVCRICGEEKEFSNSPPEFVFTKPRSDDPELSDSLPGEPQNKQDDSE